MQNRSELALKILIIVLFLAAVGVASFKMTRPPAPNEVAQAKADLARLVEAVKKFNQDYGHYPAGASYGRYENVTSNSLLMKVLTGENETENPRKIKYLDVPAAKESFRSNAGGIDPKNGSLKDPWSWSYRVRVSTDGGGEVANPYSAEAEKTIQQPVIAWSIGRDGIQGSWKGGDKTDGADDVVSWK